MGLIDTALGLAGFQRRRPRVIRQRLDQQPPWQAEGALPPWRHETDVAAFRGYAEKYARSATEYMAINKVVEAVGMAGLNNLRVFSAGMPWETTHPVDGHALYDLLREPNPQTTQVELFESIAGWAAIAGNVYVYVHVFDNGFPHSLWVLPPTDVEPNVDAHLGLTHYTYTVNNEPFPLPAERVMHMSRFNPLDPNVGLAPSEASVLAAATDLSMQNFNRGFFLRGARPSVIFESDELIIDDKEMLGLLENMILEAHTGSADEMNKPIFAWGGFKVREWTTNQKDAEFTEGRQQNRQDIWGVRGVHPGLLTAESVNRANAEVAEYLFAKYTIAPMLTRIASQFNLDLMWRYEDDTHVGFVDVVPRDLETEAQVAADNADALEKLINMLGVEEGVAEAKRQNLISQDVNEANVFPLSAVEQVLGRPSGEAAGGEELEGAEEEVGEEALRMWRRRLDDDGRWRRPGERKAMERALAQQWHRLQVLAGVVEPEGNGKVEDEERRRMRLELMEELRAEGVLDEGVLVANGRG